MIEKLDLTESVNTLPLTIIVEGQKKELTLRDVPISVYKEFLRATSEDANAFDAIEKYALSILNCNEEGERFEPEIISQLGTSQVSLLVNAYTEWLNEVLHTTN